MVIKTSFLIGDGTGMGLPASDYFAFEACEYRRHFLSYHPDYAIMTNIDFDHPDYFKDIDDVASAFQSMAHNVKKAIIAWGDDDHLRQLKADVPIYYYGLNKMMIFTQITFKSRIKALNLMFMLMVNIMINFITSVR